jgi:diacylglycerol kinase family enzyme
MKERAGSAVIVVNPVSGGGRAGRLLADALAGAPALTVLAGDLALGSPGDWPVLETTADGGWRKELETRLGSRGVKAVLVIGGDGTITECASVMYSARGNGERVALVPIPGGRGNDLLRGLCGFGSDEGDFWKWAAARKKWKRARLDLGSANGRIFANMASIGYGGRVVEKAHNRDAVWSKTAMVYQVEGALALFEDGRGRCELTGDGRRVYADAFFGAFVGNGKANGAGLFWTAGADPGDGKLDALVFPRPGVLAMARSLGAVKARKPPLFKHEYAQATELVFHFDRPTALELDGDFAGSSLTHEFRCLPGALDVVTIS